DEADPADGVDVALHDVSAELVADPERRLDVDRVARPEAGEGRARKRLGNDVERELPVLRLHVREADARHGHGVANVRVRRRLGGPDDETGAVESGYGSELPDDSREHGTRLRLAQVRLQQHVLAGRLGAQMEELERPFEIAEHARSFAG